MSFYAVVYDRRIRWNRYLNACILRLSYLYTVTVYYIGHSVACNICMN